MAHAEQRGIVSRTVEAFQAIPGRGVTAREGANRIAAGNAALMADLAIEVDRAQLEAFARDGKTPLFFAKNGALMGTIAVADELKPTAGRPSPHSTRSACAPSCSRATTSLRRMPSPDVWALGRSSPTCSPPTRSAWFVSCKMPAIGSPWWATATTPRPRPR